MAAPLVDPTFDGHTHTPFCPHGSDRPLAEYLDQAVARGLRRYAVTEHIPYPVGLRDPMGPFECAAPIATLQPYLAEVEALREATAGRIEVLPGLEIDYLGGAQGGWHGDLLRLLAGVWDRLEPEATLLSVHFVDDLLIDATPEMSRALLRAGETVDDLHCRYYALLRSAITASWRWQGRDLRPRRIGHLALPCKFLAKLPLTDPERVWDAATSVLELALAEGLQVEINTAGFDKPDWGRSYLPEPLLGRAVALGVELVLGSDAHAPEEVGRHFGRVAAGTP